MKEIRRRKATRRKRKPKIDEMKEMTRPWQWRRRQQRQRSKQKKNCGRPGSTQSHRRNKTFSQVFLHFFFSLFSAFLDCAFALLIHIYLCIDKYRKHTHTHRRTEKGTRSWSIKVSYTMRFGWFAQNLCNKCEEKKARAALSTFAQLTTRTSNNNNNDINIAYYYYTRFDRRPSPSYQCERT